MRSSRRSEEVKTKGGAGETTPLARSTYSSETFGPQNSPPPSSPLGGPPQPQRISSVTQTQTRGKTGLNSIY
eukprot:scaffold304922_cov17-Tisochrysis_lutea.AAC.1